jgi:fido (protein-threonine AMPylation protein)
VYLPPAHIAGRLQTLVSFVNKNLAAAMDIEISTVDRLKLHLRVSTLFFSEFLKIHPFSNGNGRTARLLVNRLMMHVSVVPISLFLDRQRVTYLKLLGSAQWEANPVGLAAMFLLSAKRTAIMAEFLLVTNDED